MPQLSVQPLSRRHRQALALLRPALSVVPCYSRVFFASSRRRSLYLALTLTGQRTHSHTGSEGRVQIKWIRTTACANTSGRCVMRPMRQLANNSSLCVTSIFIGRGVTGWTRNRPPHDHGWPVCDQRSARKEQQQQAREREPAPTL